MYRLMFLICLVFSLCLSGCGTYDFLFADEEIVSGVSINNTDSSSISNKKYKQIKPTLNQEEVLVSPVELISGVSPFDNALINTSFYYSEGSDYYSYITTYWTNTYVKSTYYDHSGLVIEDNIDFIRNLSYLHLVNPMQVSNTYEAVFDISKYALEFQESFVGSDGVNYTLFSTLSKDSPFLASINRLRPQIVVDNLKSDFLSSEYEVILTVNKLENKLTQVEIYYPSSIGTYLVETIEFSKFNQINIDELLIQDEINIAVNDEYDIIMGLISLTGNPAYENIDILALLEDTDVQELISNLVLEVIEKHKEDSLSANSISGVSENSIPVELQNAIDYINQNSLSDNTLELEHDNALVID